MITKKEKEVAELDAKAESEADAKKFARKATKSDRAYAELASSLQERLTHTLFKCYVDECSSVIVNITKKLRTEVFAKVEELESRVLRLERSIDCSAVQETVEELVFGFHELKTTLDAVDNRTRQNTPVVYGLKGCEPFKDVQSLLKEQSTLASTVHDAHFFGTRKENGKCPVLVKFSTPHAKNKFLAKAKTATFRKYHPGVRAAQDESKL